MRRGGQGVLNVLALGAVKDDLDVQLGVDAAAPAGQAPGAARLAL
jgi:hypothetical protein